MPYETDGTLVTDKRTINDSDGWDTQAEWEAYQSATNVEISNGAIELLFYEPVPTTGLDNLWWGPSIQDISTYPDEEGPLDMSATGDPQLGSINTRGAAVYDGTDDNHSVGSAPALGSGSVWTAVCVVDLSDNGNMQVVFDLGTAVSNSGGFDLQARFNDGVYGVAHSGVALESGGTLGTGAEVWVATYDGTNVIMDVNKTEVINASIATPDPVQNRTTIGSAGTDGAWTNGAVGAAGYEATAADATRRDDLTDTLANEFNITV